MHEMIQRIKCGKFERALDIGCSDGAETAPLKRIVGRLIVGVDVNRGKLREAKRRGIAAVRARGENLPFRAGSFDLVVSSYLVHELSDAESGVREMRRVVKEGGTVLCRDWLKGAPVSPGQRPKTFKQLRKLFERAGFKIAFAEQQDGPKAMLHAVAV